MNWQNEHIIIITVLPIHPIRTKVWIAILVTWKQHFRSQISSEEQVNSPPQGVYCYAGWTISFPLEGSLPKLLLFVYRYEEQHSSASLKLILVLKSILFFFTFLS